MAEPRQKQQNTTERFSNTEGVPLLRGTSIRCRIASDPEEEIGVGSLATYHCRDCGFTTVLQLGAGMLYPRVCDAMKRDISSGEYGPELKQAFDGVELPAVRPERKVYLCPRCGHWDVSKDASVYEPVDAKAIRAKRFGSKTVEELGGIPYIMWWEIEDGTYRLVRPYQPTCPCCSKGMRPVFSDSKGEVCTEQLKCPECGSLNTSMAMEGFWDQ